MAQTEQDKAIIAQKRGRLASNISDSDNRHKFIAAQGEADKNGGSDASYLPVVTSTRNEEVRQALDPNTLHSSADDPSHDFEMAIAGAEGYGKHGTIPTLRHNPGDLKLGKGGVTSFPNEKAGFRALHNQIQAIDNGKSHVYTPDMTLQDMAQKYTTTQPGDWANNVAKALHVPPETTVGNILHPKPISTVSQHEAGHGVVGETLMPGSVAKMGITPYGGGQTDLAPKPIGTMNDVKNYMGMNYAGAEAEPGTGQYSHARGDRDARAALIGGMADTPMNNLHRMITGGAGKNDIMVQAPQLMAAGNARAIPILADPHAHQQMQAVGKKLDEDKSITGDTLRDIMRSSK